MMIKLTVNTCCLSKLSSDAVCWGHSHSVLSGIHHLLFHVGARCPKRVQRSFLSLDDLHDSCGIISSCLRSVDHHRLLHCKFSQNLIQPDKFANSLLFNLQLWNVFVSIVNWIWMAANVSFIICCQTVWRWNLIPFFYRCISFCAFGASTKSWQSCKPDILSCSTRKKCKRRVPSSLSLFYHQKVDPFWCVAAHHSIEAKKLISAVNLYS